jgi:hypothetical protein
MPLNGAGAIVGLIAFTRRGGGAAGQEGNSIDLDPRVQQQAGDLHSGAGGRLFRKEPPRMRENAA